MEKALMLHMLFHALLTQHPPNMMSIPHCHCCVDSLKTQCVAISLCIPMIKLYSCSHRRLSIPTPREPDPPYPPFRHGLIAFCEDIDFFILFFLYFFCIDDQCRFHTAGLSVCDGLLWKNSKNKFCFASPSNRWRSFVLVCGDSPSAHWRGIKLTCALIKLK